MFLKANSQTQQFQHHKRLSIFLACLISGYKHTFLVPDWQNFAIAYVYPKRSLGQPPVHPTFAEHIH